MKNPVLNQLFCKKFQSPKNLLEQTFLQKAFSNQIFLRAKVF
jgi:hypothetical protein